MKHTVYDSSMLPINVFIIGSISQEEELRNVADLYAQLGCEVQHVMKESDHLMNLIEKAYTTIREWADLVVVVPKSVYPVMSLGHGTQYEICYAKSLGKPVVFQHI